MNTCPVHLHQNGAYWLARWRTATGQPKAQSIGRRDQLSKRDAVIACQRLADEFALWPAKRSNAAAPTLGALIAQYTAARPDLAEKSLVALDITARALMEHLGAETRIDQITPAHALAWTAWLRTHPDRFGRMRGDATIHRHARYAKQLFNYAVDAEVIRQNPFRRLESASIAGDHRGTHVARQVIAQVIEAEPDLEWKVLIGLARFAGLRCPSETHLLEWPQVDWARARLLQVVSTKNGTKRDIPITPDLMPLLRALYDSLPEGAPARILHLPTYATSLGRHLRALLKRAGVAPWADLYQNLRRGAATDWREQYPAHIVAAWMDHSQAVEDAHYLQLREEFMLRASAIIGDHKDAPAANPAPANQNTGSVAP